MANQELLSWVDSIKDQTIDWHGFRALPWNLPDKRAGLYLFVEIKDGSPYIGISQNVYVRTRNHAGNNSPKTLRSAFKACGKHSFILLPLIYWTGDLYDLKLIEAEFIITWDAIHNGYNVKAAEGTIGPYGDEFSKIMKQRWAAPGAREKQSERMKAVLATAEMRARWSEATKNSDSPERRRRQAASLRAAIAHNPEVQRNRAEGTKKRTESPEWKKALAAAMTEIRKRDNYRDALSKHMKREWADPERRQGRIANLKAASSTPEAKARSSALGKSFVERNGAKWLSDRGVAARKAKRQEEAPTFPLLFEEE